VPGLAFIAQTFGTILLIVKWLGVAYLAYLAYVFWTTGIKPETIEARKGEADVLVSFVAGLAVTLGNPKPWSSISCLSRRWSTCMR